MNDSTVTLQSGNEGSGRYWDARTSATPTDATAMHHQRSEEPDSVGAGSAIAAPVRTVQVADGRRACHAYERTTTDGRTDGRSSCCRPELANHVTAMFTRPLHTLPTPRVYDLQPLRSSSEPFNHERTKRLILWPKAWPPASKAWPQVSSSENVPNDTYSKTEISPRSDIL